MQMRSLPFQLPDQFLREFKGRIYLEERFLVLEIEDSLIGEFDKEIRVVKIEPAALREIRLDRGIIRDRICMTPKNRQSLEDVPGFDSLEAQLKIWKKYRRESEELVEEVRRRARATDE